MKSKFKSFKFWMGLASAVLLLIQAIAEPLGLEIDESVYMSIVIAILGVFVVLGIVSKDNPLDTDDDTLDHVQDKTDNQNKDNDQND